MWPVLEPRGPLGVRGGWSVSPGGVGTDVGVVVILLTPVVGGVAGPPTYVHTSFVDSLDCHMTP